MSTALRSFIIAPPEEKRTLMKRHLKLVAACGLAACAPSVLHAAQGDSAPNYPTKPVRFICPFAPGAGTDLTARTIAQKLGEKFGHQFVVDNRTGAGGAIGVDTVAKAIPDGYTIGLISASNSVNAATNPGLPYVMERDLQGIAQATSLFYVMYTHPSVPAKTVKELIAYAKANPGKLNFGSSGNNTLQHFSGELFNHMAGVKITHVTYKGTAAVIPAMLAGEVQLGFGSLIGTRAQMQAGKLRGEARAVDRPADDRGIGPQGLRSRSMVRRDHVVQGAAADRAQAQRRDR